MNTFGERLRRLREERLENQDDIARLLNVTRATISKYETNDREPDIKFIRLLSKHFDVSVDFLFCESDTRNMPNSISDNIKLIMGNMTEHEFVKALKKKTGVQIKETEIKNYTSNKFTPITAVLNLFADYAGVDLNFFLCKHSKEDLEIARKEKIKNSTYYSEFQDIELFMRDKNFVNLALKIKNNNLDIKTVDCIISNILLLRNS